MVSLGGFCSVAEEIEKLGLRSASYPFDWILTDGKTVEEIMKGEFAAVSYTHLDVYKRKWYNDTCDFKLYELFGHRVCHRSWEKMA